MAGGRDPRPSAAPASPACRPARRMFTVFFDRQPEQFGWRRKSAKTEKSCRSAASFPVVRPAAEKRKIALTAQAASGRPAGDPRGVAGQQGRVGRPLADRPQRGDQAGERAQQTQPRTRNWLPRFSLQNPLAVKLPSTTIAAVIPSTTGSRAPAEEVRQNEGDRQDQGREMCFAAHRRQQEHRAMAAPPGRTVRSPAAGQATGLLAACGQVARPTSAQNADLQRQRRPGKTAWLGFRCGRRPAIARARARPKAGRRSPPRLWFI